MMKPWIVNFISTVQLTRLANAFAGVANLWFIALWSRSHSIDPNATENLTGTVSEIALWKLLAITAFIGVGLSTYAGAVNDLFDQRKDRVFAPDKPLPAGRITPQAAAAIGFASLIISIVCATILGPGPAIMCLVAAALILIYNVVTRHIPGLGFVTIAAIFGIHMLTINIGLKFIWPVLFIMIHATVVHAVVYRLEEKRPKITTITIVGTVIGLVALTIALVAQAGHQGVVWQRAYTWYGLMWPVAAVIVFAVTAVNKIRFSSGKTYAAEKLQRYGALWMGIYGLTWLLGAGLYLESIFLGALVLAGLLWMLIIRDLGAWIEQPVGYRW